MAARPNDPLRGLERRCKAIRDRVASEPLPTPSRDPAILEAAWELQDVADALHRQADGLIVVESRPSRDAQCDSWRHCVCDERRSVAKRIFSVAHVQTRSMVRM